VFKTLLHIDNLDSFNNSFRYIILFINCRWVEFAKKSVAKRVADMLNGEQIGIPNESYQYA